MTITTDPALPAQSWDDVVVTFSRQVTIQDFLQHVKVTMWGAGDDYEAVLTNMGSGKIGIKQTPSDEETSYFEGDGTNITYTWKDMSSHHGSRLKGIEWQD